MGHPTALFCSRPFTWMEISIGQARGDVFLCCPSWLDVPAGNLQRQSVPDVWNGEPAREIRRSILDQSFAHCNAHLCPFLKTVSGPVQRMEDVSDPDLLDVIRERRVVMHHGPEVINCCYDKSCNLACPSCRTRLIVETAHDPEILAIQTRVESEALPSAKTLRITGSGDPFGSPHFRRWLRTIGPSQLARLRNIHLHTNALLWTSPMWEMIPPATRSLIRTAEVSIDAASAETYAMNRGGDFSRLMSNLALISQLLVDGELDEVTISMVVQANNFGEMPDFVGLGQKLGFRVYFSQLVNWGTYSPKEYLERAVHLDGHPLHDQLRTVVRSEVFARPFVSLGNLADLASTPR